MIEAIVGSVLTAIAGSDGAKAAGKQFSLAVWETVKPYLIVEDDPKKEELEKAVVAVLAAAPPPPAAEALVKERLHQKLAEQPERVAALQQLFQERPEGFGKVDNRGATINKQVNNPIINGDFKM